MTPEQTTYQLTCSCGWTHTATGRKSATMWKQYHRETYRETGSRVNENGHDVTVSKVKGTADV